ncbi:MAG: amidase [Planctomycetota bacterium]|jgi:Asp-tRNA(Asn)/Glu-tRNA(Gln) amidotransferase A subunit family amidase|nr:amidase [Planctomycetota bacterium]MDA1025340.1 amidase [Planctomycetota bacterium]
MSIHDPDRRRLLISTATLAALPLAAAATAAQGSRTIEPQEGPEPNAWPDGPDDASITPAIIAAAERLAGIQFTEKERATIAKTVGEQMAIFAARVDAGAMPNELAPATVFRAMPPDRALDPATSTGNAGLVVADPGSLPDDDAAIAFSTVADLCTWMRRGDLTSERLTRIYLDRIERIDPKLECMITVTGDRAIEQARRADSERKQGRDRGPLHGIPYGAKDILDVADVRATWGATPFKDRIGTTTATVIEKLDDAGAVMLGKTSVGALAYGDIWFGGRTNNPWNLKQGSSGSSAGSASGTVGGLMAFGLGTETLGSIVSPAMVCGATGLRPTFGRVSRAGAMSLCWSLDKIGPICRSVNDTALVLAAINGLDTRDASSVGVPFAYDATQGVKGLRVGWNPAWYEGANPADRAALEHLREAGCQLVEVDLPDLPYESLLVPLYAEAAAAFESLTRSGDDDLMAWQSRQAWPNTFRRSWFIPAIEAVQADRVRRQVMDAMARIMDTVDALATPAFAANLLLITNATGHPTLVQPIVFDEGRPHGFTLIGRLFDEGTICRLGRELERRCDVAKLHPTL